MDDDDMNLAASSSSDPNPNPKKRCRKTKPRMGMIFRGIDNEYLFYIVDLNLFSDEKLKEKYSPPPAFRFNIGEAVMTEYGMCFLGSTLYIFAEGARDFYVYQDLDDAARRSFKSTRSVFSLDSSKTDAALQMLPLGLLWSKIFPAAIPTPKKNGDILVFSSTLKPAPAYELGYSDFEVYNPLTGSRRGLPGLLHYLVNKLGFSSHSSYMVESYGFVNDGRFLVQVVYAILSIDIESDQGWQRIETPALIDRWEQFYSFHDDFWLTAKAGYYLPKGGKMFKEGAPRFMRCDDDDDDDDGGGRGGGGGGGGGDGDYDHDNTFEYPISTNFDKPGYRNHLLYTLVGDSSFCIARSVVEIRYPHFPQVIVDLFELDHDKLLQGYDQGGCKLVSSVVLHIPIVGLIFEPIILCAIDDEYPTAT